MKKKIALILACCLLFALAACADSGVYIHDEPAVTLAPQTPEPEPVAEEPRPDIAAEIGAPVIVNVKRELEEKSAPDGSDQTILTYGYDAVRVYLEGNPEAAEEINQYLAMQDELMRSGTVPGEGINAMLELAYDNFGLAMDLGKGGNLEFSWMRSASIRRGDSKVLSVLYDIYSYTGGAHGESKDRAFVFDVETGSLLTIDDLFTDRDALEQAMLDKMLGLIQSDVRYQTIQDYMTMFRPDDKLEDVLKSLFREGSWILDNDGFTVFSDIDEIGTYSDGIISFTLGYDEMADILHEEFLPPDRPEDGTLMLRALNDQASAGIALRDAVTVDANGTAFRLYAEGTIYDVSIDSVTYFSDHIGFYHQETHWFCSYLCDSGVQIRTLIPAGMPNLMIRYTDSSGEEHSMLLTQSGENGEVILLDKDNVTAVG